MPNRGRAEAEDVEQVLLDLLILRFAMSVESEAFWLVIVHRQAKYRVALHHLLHPRNHLYIEVQGVDGKAIREQD